MKLTFSWLVLLGAAAGCDDTVVYPSTGSSGAGAGGSGSTGSLQTGGNGPCESPSGFRVCGGTNACAKCDGPCFGGGDPQLCVNDALAAEPATETTHCPDGYVFYWEVGTVGLICVPEEFGFLLCENGAQESARFTDLGLYDCQPLPAPGDCPQIDGLTLCGDSCGACPAGKTCRGRSRLHPYSMCVASDVWCGGGDGALDGCPDGTGCFTYTVEPEAQQLATDLSFCMPIGECLAAEAGLPGGGTCTPPAL